MSAWIDFAVFAAQAVMMFIVAPRWGAPFSRAMLFDRNPQWAAANPAAVARFERAGGWHIAMQVWGVITVLVLLVFRLGLQPAALTQGVPDWQVMQNTNSPLFMVGFVMYGLSVAWFFRQMKAQVPLGEQRRASLTPRRLDDFVPRWLQYPAFALVLAGIVSRPVVDWFYPGHFKDVWAGFFFSLLISAALVVAVIACVARRANAMDRIFGIAYRRREVRACFALMVWCTLGGFITLWLEFNGLDTLRFSAISQGVTLTALMVACVTTAVPPEDVSGSPAFPIALRR